MNTVDEYVKEPLRLKDAPFLLSVDLFLLLLVEVLF